MLPSTEASSEIGSAWTAATVTAALALLALAALGPLGLASGKAAGLAAGALGVGCPLSDAAPLADLLGRIAVLVPLGEVGARPHAVAAFGGALALGLLVARMRLTPRPAASVAVAAGAIMVAVSRPFLEVATMGAGAALDLALLVGIAFLLELFRRDPARSWVGLGFALCCGLAAGASWPVRAVAWPLGAATTTWALRRGQRWPLLAPTTFVAGTGISFSAVVAAAPVSTTTVGAFVRHIVLPSFPSSWHVAWTMASAHAILASVADDVGVLALLAAAIGAAVLLVRARVETLLWLLVWGGAAAAWLVTNGIGGDGAPVRLALVVGLAPPVASGVGVLADSLGRARVAAAFVLTMVIALPPAYRGVGGAIDNARRASPGVVARRLDAAAARLTAESEPHPVAAAAAATDDDADRWRRYLRAVGADTR